MVGRVCRSGCIRRFTAVLLLLWLNFGCATTEQTRLQKERDKSYEGGALYKAAETSRRLYESDAASALDISLSTERLESGASAEVERCRAMRCARGEHRAEALAAARRSRRCLE